MLCALTSKRLGAKYTIARIRDVAYTEDLASLQKDLSIDSVINPEYSTALEISRLLRFPAAANVDTFFRGKVEMLGVRVRETDSIVGHPLSELFGHNSPNILFSACERKGQVIIPNGDFVPQAGDKLYVTGTPRDLSAYLRTLGPGPAEDPLGLSHRRQPHRPLSVQAPAVHGRARDARREQRGALPPPCPSGSPTPWSYTATARTRSCWPPSISPTTTPSSP